MAHGTNRPMTLAEALDAEFADASNARHFSDDGEDWRVFNQFEDLIMGPPRVPSTPEEITELYLAMPVGIGREQAARKLSAALLHPTGCVCHRCLDPSDFSEIDDMWISYEPVDPSDEGLERCECDLTDRLNLCRYCEKREIEAWAAWVDVEKNTPPETVVPGCSQAVGEAAEDWELEFDRATYGARHL